MHSVYSVAKNLLRFRDSQSGIWLEFLMIIIICSFLPRFSHLLTRKSLVILDAGFASKKNIAVLKARSLGYVINITRTCGASRLKNQVLKSDDPSEPN